MRRSRGHSAGLTREKVLDAAMALVDRDGLSGLSMRRLGAELGVEAMTLYHHVPSKDALLDGLVERLLAGASEPLFADASWQAALHGFAHAWHDALRAHPNLMPLVLTRPAITPENLGLMERVLERLHRAGFPLDRALDVVYAVAGYVVGQAATPTIDAAGADQARVLAAADLEDFPLLAEAARTRATHRGERIDYALDAMLAGFQADLGAPTDAPVVTPGPPRRTR